MKKFLVHVSYLNDDYIWARNLLVEKLEKSGYTFLENNGSRCLFEDDGHFENFVKDVENIAKNEHIVVREVLCENDKNDRIWNGFFFTNM